MSPLKYRRDQQTWERGETEGCLGRDLERVGRRQRDAVLVVVLWWRFKAAQAERGRGGARHLLQARPSYAFV